MSKESIRQWLRRMISVILNPRFLLCFGLAWLLTNGWAYVMAALGAVLQIGWMIAVSGTYLTFLWFPFTPEKLLTVTLAIVFLRLLFPRDEKTLGVLREMVRRVRGKKKDKKWIKKREV